MTRDRAQAQVVGVALLLGITVVALGTLTASVGTVVEGNAARADAGRVATDLATALEPVETTGRNRGRISFTAGRLFPVDRDLRVLDDDGVVRTVAVGGLVFEHGTERVASVAGAVVVGRNGSASLATRPPITASRGAGVLVVGAPRVGTPASVSGSGGVTVDLQTTVTHDRERLGNGTYRVAIETETPGAWERYFERQNATVSRRTFDDDGVVSVVAAFPGERVGYLVHHDLHLEVRHG